MPDEKCSWVSVWCYDKCHSICQRAAIKNAGTSCKCRCHDA